MPSIFRHGISWIALVLVNSLTNPAQADTVACAAAEQGLKEYFQALQQHQLPALQKMLSEVPAIKLEWLDNEPSKHFTLSRENYLQQLEAIWHFGRDEKLTVQDMRWQQPEATRCLAEFRLQEARRIFDTDTGLDSQMQVQLTQRDGRWRITQIHTRTRSW